ncbi:MAG: reverse transcriptase domain-containing protein, partial [Candidatus Bathyarchaeia archaeon]
DSEGAEVLDHHGSILLKADAYNGLYYLRPEHGGEASEVVASSSPVKVDEEVQLWHHRLGHLSYSTLSKLISEQGCEGLEALKPDKVSAAQQARCVCEACIYGKGTKNRKGKNRSNKASVPLERVWFDIQGPFPDSEGGKRYLLLIIDEATRRAWALGLANKNDAGKAIMDWHKRVMVELGKPMKEFRSDQGGEFITTELKRYFTGVGVKMTFTQEYTPHHRGIVERLGRTIVEIASCMLQKAKAVKSLWLDAATLAMEIHNKAIIKKGFTSTPMELWTGIKPDLKYMRVFGCDAWYHVPTQKRKKLDSKGHKGMFIGFSEETLGWRILDVETMQVKVSKDVVFMEEEFTASEQLRESREDDYSSDEQDDFQYFERLTFDNETKLVQKISKEMQSEGNDVDPQAGGDSEEDVEPVDQAPRRSTRKTKPPNYYAKVSKDDIGQAHAADTAKLSVSEREPTTFEEILDYSDHDKSLWMAAIKEEEDSLNKLGVLADVALQDTKPIHQVVKCRLIFKNKVNSSGKVVRNKVRVVAKGYTQREGIDYNETFAPVLQYKSLRVILSIVANLDLEFKQLDIKTAFLYAQVTENIQIVVPQGFSEAGKVKKLMKALYGIKQAPHQWNEEIDGTLRALGYRPCISDCCVYVKRTRNDLTIFLTIFVDDITVAYHISDEEEYLADKKAIMDKYEISDLGNVEHLLGMRITRDRNKKYITLDQSAAVEQLLKSCKMDQCTTVKSPEESNPDHAVESPPIVDSSVTESPLGDFRSIVGSLNYLAGSTRPDIAHAVGLLCRQVNQPMPVDWRLLKRVLRYLRGTSKLCLSFSGSAGKLGEILVFTDADWGGDQSTRKSTSGTIIKVNGNVVLWGSKKQKTPALSSAESEYMALGVAVQEALWMRSFMEELGFKSNGPTI